MVLYERVKPWLVPPVFVPAMLLLIWAVGMSQW
jgi:hypothetical protein